MRLPNLFNSYLDKLVRTEVHALHRPWPAFKVCGYTGLALAILLAMTLTLHRGLSPWVMAIVIPTAMATFLGLAMATKIVTGEERLTYYHHEIAILALSGLLLWLLRQPILPYLDIVILGVGAFLACGRVGCLLVGCCHGRPHHWGVCYGEKHRAAGFTHYFVGVRLFPIQAVESLWVLSSVVVGSLLILRNHPPGEALAWTIIAYDLGRFGFEFLRGDPDRPYHWGFSEAQWTSLLLMLAVAAAELAGLLPLRLWHLAATAGLILVMAGLTLSRRLRETPRRRLLHPRHVREVAEAMRLAAGQAAAWRAIPGSDAVAAGVAVGLTSLGVQLSASQIDDAAGRIDHYALSAQDGTMSEEEAGILADLIVQLKHPARTYQLLASDRKVFHLLIQPDEVQTHDR